MWLATSKFATKMAILTKKCYVSNILIIIIFKFYFRLKTHQRNMHQRIKCDECGQEICNTFILKRHKATVHGTRPDDVFQCEYCPLFYNRASAREKHIQKQHSEHSAYRQQT